MLTKLSAARERLVSVMISTRLHNYMILYLLYIPIDAHDYILMGNGNYLICNVIPIIPMKTGILKSL